jgi:hypothetical protein
MLAPQGESFSCSDPSFPAGKPLFGDLKLPCNGTITEPFYNYDNIFRGLISTFIITAYVPEHRTRSKGPPTRRLIPRM